MAVVTTIAELERVFGTGRPQFLEVWAQRPEGSALCALVNGQLGWLMFLREPGDAGFSSRNPSYTGPADATVEYQLENGQEDLYPASWAVELGDLVNALRSFLQTGVRPSGITWHDDSESPA